jgi:hypothetical protein
MEIFIKLEISHFLKKLILQKYANKYRLSYSYFDWNISKHALRRLR